MKALSLTQPWATLVAIGAKNVETRSWYTDYRGPVAIHAAKAFPSDAARLCATEPFRSALAAAGITRSDTLPRGAIVALADLTQVVPVHLVPAEARIEPEQSFGDYSPGRYAFVLENVRRLAAPLACNGALSLWKMPAALQAAVYAQLGVAPAPDPQPSLFSWSPPSEHTAANTAIYLDRDRWETGNGAQTVGTAANLKPGRLPSPDGPEYDGPVYDPMVDHDRLAQQTRDVWDALTESVDRWWSFAELQERIVVAKERYHSEAAISARLRDFRKPKFGRYTVERRAEGGGLFRYRLDPDEYRARLASYLRRLATV